ncbi:hypothetical protein IV203_035227 [Nitzschia inconspicua]|uniref:Uncharacterized protein n=1 Tax=Nitzschia inconspicua TaxID=303405 RepID=A0A9K3LDM2_9STRA|nr:hypothetical protein IV203_035227 [Nitzschia inconspicua]
MQRVLSDNLLFSPSREAATKHRSPSPSYLRDTQTGERRIRRSTEELDDLAGQKMKRKSIVGSSLANTMERNDKLGEGSISNDSNTSRTADDSFCSNIATSLDGRSPASACPSIKRATMSKDSRASRNAFILVSPKRATTTSSRKKSGRRISLALDGHSSLPIIGAFDEEKSVDQSIESRGRKQAKESSKESKKEKKSKKKKAGRSKSVCIAEEDDKPSKSCEKKKERRNKSVGPATTLGQPNLCRHAVGLSKKASLMNGKSATKIEEQDRRSRSASKFRTTVDETGKIRRTQSQRSQCQDDTSQDSRSSKRCTSTASVSRSPKKKHSQMEANKRSSSDFSRSSMNAASPASGRLLLERQSSGLSHRSERVQSTGARYDMKFNPIESSDLQKEIDSLQEELLVVRAGQNAGTAEISRLNRELRKTRLELKRSITERGEMRLQIQDQDLIIKEKDHKIEVLEKAIESQLDKVDELQEELRKVYDDIFTLESRIASMTRGGDGDKSIDNQNHSDSQHELGGLKSTKGSDLERRSLYRKEKTAPVMNKMPHQDIKKLLQENEILPKVLHSERDENGTTIYENKDEVPPTTSDTSHDGLQSDEVEAVSKMQRELYLLRQQMRNRSDGFEAAKEEGRMMRTKWEEARRRNLILEEDIHHWKSTNCALEEELDEMKAEAAMWKAKYLTAACGAGSSSSIGRGSTKGMRSAADISMMRLGEDNEKDSLDGSQSSLASFWSKLTKSNSVRSMNQSFHSANSRDGTIGKLIF